MKTFEIVKKTRIWLIALLVYLLLIFILSHVSGQRLPRIPFPNVDKIVHFLEYLPVGFLLGGALYSKFSDWRFMHIIPAVAGLAATLGGLDEFHQSFVPGRCVSLGDGVADVLGAVVGAILCAYFIKQVSGVVTTAKE